MWTTPSDFALLKIELYHSYLNDSAQLLSQTMLGDMVKEVEPSECDLGPRLEYLSGQKMIKHSGSNNPFRAFFRFNH